ncbi:hypothetical protein CJU78_22285 [Pseudomonas fragi]|nr:hypothetical protein CJU78_22285 [Pseudomonas fragi]
MGAIKGLDTNPFEACYLNYAAFQNLFILVFNDAFKQCLNIRLAVQIITYFKFFHHVAPYDRVLSEAKFKFGFLKGLVVN